MHAYLRVCFPAGTMRDTRLRTLETEVPVTPGTGRYTLLEVPWAEKGGGNLLAVMFPMAGTEGLQLL